MELVAALGSPAEVAAFVRQNLRGGGALGALRSDCWPVDAVLRVHSELAGSPLAARLEDGVAACLTDQDPFVRSQAQMFFEIRPRPRRSAPDPGRYLGDHGTPSA
jgi:hypothetical protein